MEKNFNPKTLFDVFDMTDFLKSSNEKQIDLMVPFDASSHWIAVFFSKLQYVPYSLEGVSEQNGRTMISLKEQI